MFLWLVGHTFRLVLYSNHLVWKHLLSCRDSVPRQHFTIEQRTKPIVLQRKLYCHKHPTHDLVTSQHARKSLHVFCHRVSNISAGQTGNTSGQSLKKNLKGSHSSRQVCRIGLGQFTNPQLFGYEIYVYVSRFSLCHSSFGVWHVTDYTFCFFFTN